MRRKARRAVINLHGRQSLKGGKLREDFERTTYQTILRGYRHQLRANPPASTTTQFKHQQTKISQLVKNCRMSKRQELITEISKAWPSTESNKAYLGISGDASHGWRWDRGFNWQPLCSYGSQNNWRMHRARLLPATQFDNLIFLVLCEHCFLSHWRRVLRVSASSRRAPSRRNRYFLRLYARVPETQLFIPYLH